MEIHLKKQFEEILKEWTMKNGISMDLTDSLFDIQFFDALIKAVKERDEYVIGEDEEIVTLPAEQIEKEKMEADMSSRALTLEMVGDLPFADIKPPENVLFVCKLNPVTRDEDLELIFSRFGTIIR